MRALRFGPAFVLFTVLFSCLTSCGCADCPTDISPLGEVVKVACGFVYTEGPAADTRGNLYFNDLRDENGKMYRLDAATGKIDLWIDGTDRANGMAINAQGEIVACQSKTGRVVAYRPDGSGFRVLADGYHGKRFNAPNDLVIDKQGGVYFTDPCFDSHMLILPQRVKGVYYIAPDGQVCRLLENIHCPNGIGLSPDERTLYVVPSTQPEVMAYPILAPGHIGVGRIHTYIAITANLLYPGGDGMTVDVAGNLYICTQRGVQIFNAEGKRVGLIRVPERPANVEFAGRDFHTLYITAKHSLYAVAMPIPGR